MSALSVAISIYTDGLTQHNPAPVSASRKLSPSQVLSTEFWTLTTIRLWRAAKASCISIKHQNLRLTSGRHQHYPISAASELEASSSRIWDCSPLDAISIGRLTGRPRVANLIGGADVDSTLMSVRMRMFTDIVQSTLSSVVCTHQKYPQHRI